LPALTKHSKLSCTADKSPYPRTELSQLSCWEEISMTLAVYQPSPTALQQKQSHHHHQHRICRLHTPDAPYASLLASKAELTSPQGGDMGTPTYHFTSLSCLSSQ
jgi:hypothetical protein